MREWPLIVFCQCQALRNCQISLKHTYQMFAYVDIGSFRVSLQWVMKANILVFVHYLDWHSVMCYWCFCSHFIHDKSGKIPTFTLKRHYLIIFNETHTLSWEIGVALLGQLNLDKYFIQIGLDLKGLKL